MLSLRIGGLIVALSAWLAAVPMPACAADLAVVYIAPSAESASGARAFGGGARLYFEHVNARGGIGGARIAFETRELEGRLEDDAALAAVKSS